MAAKARPRRPGERGVAIEMAMVMLVVVFALCTLLLTFSLTSRNGSKSRGQALEQSAALEQLGEDFLYAVRQDNFDAAAYAVGSADYTGTVTVEGDTYCLTLTRRENSRHALTVKVERQGNGEWKLVTWSKLSTTQS